MTGKTHVAVGAAVAVAVAQPTTVRSLVISAAAAVVGSIISDIDVSTSESHKGLVKVCTIVSGAVVAAAVVEYYWHLGILAMLQSQSSLWRILTALAAFLVVCWFGAHQPHRSFMHSVAAVAIMTVITGWMLPAAALPFCAAMISHIVLDLLNRRKVRLLYPLPWGWSLDICQAQGYVNNMICLAGTAVVGLEVLLFALHLTGRF